MILTDENITNESFDGYHSSFEKKYHIYDNLDGKGESTIFSVKEFNYSEHVYIVVVLRGSLNLVVGGTDVHMKSNDFLLVTPCLQITIKESRCLFFTYCTKAYVMSEIYKHMGICDKNYFHAFKFKHAHFTPEKTNILLDCYMRSKKEHMREDYPMKEYTLRAYLTALLAKIFSFAQKEDWQIHVKNTRYYELFNLFLDKLNQNYKKERSVQYYANAMNIAPKYLSAVICSYTGLTASQAIDRYVIFAIKQSLYSNEHNIKTISKEFHFPNQSFFGRYFKRITGVSPHDYMKSHNLKSINFNQDCNKEG